MTAFADLHVPGRPLVLPNAWDHASAAGLAAAGFDAVGTTSLGVAAALGLPDGAGAIADATVALARRLARLPVPVTVDIEDGFSRDPAEVAGYVERLGPVAGVNLEDRLEDPARLAAAVAAVRERVPGVFVNARADTWWLGRPSVPETLDRARRYVAAGAHGVFVPGVRDAADVAALAEGVGAPLNVLLLPDGPPVPRLAQLGVARVSTGSLLYRVAHGAAVATAQAVLAGQAPPAAPSYADVDGLASGAGP